MDLQSEISAANDYRQRSRSLVSGEYSDDSRVLLLIAYTDLVNEHHAAIMNLLEQKIYGSAFALVRIHFEAFMTSPLFPQIGDMANRNVDKASVLAHAQGIEVLNPFATSDSFQDFSLFVPPVGRHDDRHVPA
jgi:hypothetical protein